MLSADKNRLLNVRRNYEFIVQNKSLKCYPEKGRQQIGSKEY